MKRTLLGALAILTVTLFPGTAGATVHTGSIAFAEPTNEPTIGPPPAAAVDRTETEHNVTVSYDDQSGTFTLTLEVYDPAGWGGEHPPIAFSAAPTCGGRTDEIRGHFDAYKYEGPEVYFKSEVSLSGIGGTVTGSSSFNGHLFTTTFQSPYFANQEWRCVTLQSEGASGLFGEAPEPHFSVNGYPAIPVLSPAPTAAAFVAQFPTIPSVERGHICPSIEVFGGHAHCMVEYPSKGLWHLASGTVTVEGVGYGVEVTYHKSWMRRWRTEPASCTRGWGLSGTIQTNSGLCYADMASDIAYNLREHRGTRLIGEHGTDLAGYQPIVLFRCHRRASAISCSNAVGDSFRYIP